MGATTLEILVIAKDEASAIIGGLAEKVGGLATLAGGALVAGLTAGAVALGGLAVAGVKSNAEFEQYNTQFSVLLKSADAAKERMAELAKFGQETPFDLPELVRADKILTAFGLDSQETAQKWGMSGAQIRTIVGDVAAGTGATFEEVSRNLGEFSAGVTGISLRRFEELGVTTRDQLKAMGLEFSKSGELMSPMPQAMDALLKVMKDRFGGMMEAQSHTFNGMLSNLRDWVGNTLRVVSQPIFDKLKGALEGLMAFLSSPQVQAAIQAFAQSLAVVVGHIVDFITKSGFFQGLGALLLGGFGPQSQGIVGAFGRAFQLIAPFIQVVGAFIRNMVAIVQSQMPVMQQTAQQVLASLSKQFNTTFPEILKLVTSILATIQTFWRAHGAEVIGIVGAMLQLLGALFAATFHIILVVVDTVLKVILGIFDFFSAAARGDWQGMSNALVAIVRALSEGVLGIIQALVNAFLNLIRQNTVNVKAELLSLTTQWDANMQAWRTNTINTVTNLVTNMISTVRNGVGGFVSAGRDLLNGLWDGLKSVAGSIESWVSNFVSRMLSKIRSVMRGHSPSEETRDMGRDFMAGFYLGLQDLAPKGLAMVEGTTRAYLAQARSVASTTTVSNSTKNINIYPQWKYMDQAALRDELKIYEMLTG